MQSSIPEFSDADPESIGHLLERRCGKLVPVELAESEVSPAADAGAITVCHGLMDRARRPFRRFQDRRGAHVLPAQGMLIRLLRRLLTRESIRRQDYAFMSLAKQLAVTE